MNLLKAEQEKVPPARQEINFHPVAPSYHRWVAEGAGEAGEAGENLFICSS